MYVVQLVRAIPFEAFFSNIYWCVAKVFMVPALSIVFMFVRQQCF